MTYTFRTIIERDGKHFHGYVPALLGCHTFGKTIEDAQKNLSEAIELYLLSLSSEKKEIPKGTLLAILRDIEVTKEELVLLMKAK